MKEAGKKSWNARRIVKIILISIASLILIIILLPILFRPQIISFAKKQLNKQLTATVNFKDVKISLLKHFPRLDLKFTELSIVGKDDFAGDTLLYSPATHIVTNFRTLFRSDVKIYSVLLKDPVIHAQVDSNGKQNFNIVKQSGTTSGTAPDDFTIELEKYRIENGTVTYFDDAAKIYTSLKHFNHEGRGNFTAVKYRIDASTLADSVDFQYGAITYLTNAVIDLPLVLNIDNGEEKYAFTGEQLMVNSVPLSVKGVVSAINDSADQVNIDVQTKQADFKNILTLIPGIYTQNLGKFQTSGRAVINGKINGIATATRIPSFDVKVDVMDGYIRNPDFREALQHIRLNASIVNTGGINDSTVIALKNGSAMVGEEPVQFALKIARPVTAMLMDFSLKGKVQLEKLSNILKLGDVRGLLHADVNASGPLAAFEGQQADAIRATGFLQASDFYYKDPATLPIQAKQVNLDFTNTIANISISDANYNQTSFSGTGSIYNFFNYLLLNAALRGKFTAKSPEVNLSNWNSSDHTSSSTSAAAKPFIVPADILLDIDASVGRLISEKMVLNDLKGKIVFGGRKMLFENITGRAFGGNIQVDGSYSSEKTPLQPDISLNYKLVNLDVQQTYKALVTTESLMPIGKYLSGTLSSELSANGKLGDDLSPIMSSLNGNGSLFLLNGLLSKFAPLEKLAERLDIDRLRNIATKEIRNRFSFENGRVNVLPFKFTIFGNYDFEVAGNHGFDNTMDYAIKLSLPRKELGQKGNQLFNSLLSKINKTGLNIKPDEKVSFFVKMTGSIANPGLDIQLDKTLGNEFDILKEQAEQQIKGKIDSAKATIKDSLKSIKKGILTGVKEKIFNKQDTTKQVPPAQDPNQVPPKDSSKKKQVIKSVIDIFSRKKKDSL
jgi:uncharacterized protein involved in outer membrane biogenesis